MINYKELMDEIKQAMIEKDVVKKNALKQVQAKAQDLAKQDKRDVSEEDVMKALMQEIKQLEQTKESVPSESKLYCDTAASIELLSKYLPVQMSDEECESSIKAFLETIENDVPKGKVIGMIMKEFKGKASNDRLKSAYDKVTA